MKPTVPHLISIKLSRYKATVLFVFLLILICWSLISFIIVVRQTQRINDQQLSARYASVHAEWLKEGNELTHTEFNNLQKVVNKLTRLMQSSMSLYSNEGEKVTITCSDSTMGQGKDIELEVKLPQGLGEYEYSGSTLNVINSDLLTLTITCYAHQLDTTHILAPEDCRTYETDTFVNEDTTLNNGGKAIICLDDNPQDYHSSFNIRRSFKILGYLENNYFLNIEGSAINTKDLSDFLKTVARSAKIIGT